MYTVSEQRRALHSSLKAQWKLAMLRLLSSKLCWYSMSRLSQYVYFFLYSLILASIVKWKDQNIWIGWPLRIFSSVSSPSYSGLQQFWAAFHPTMFCICFPFVFRSCPGVMAEWSLISSPTVLVLGAQGWRRDAALCLAPVWLLLWWLVLSHSWPGEFDKLIMLYCMNLRYFTGFLNLTFLVLLALITAPKLKTYMLKITEKSCPKQLVLGWRVLKKKPQTFTIKWFRLKFFIVCLFQMATLILLTALGIYIRHSVPAELTTCISICAHSQSLHS